MTQNLGIVDRVLRFLLAVWWLSSFAPQFGAGWANALIAIVGWIALAESFLGACLLHRVLSINNRNQ